MRAFGAGESRLDRAEVQLQFVGVNDVVAVVAPQALLLGVLLDGLDEFRVAVGEPQIRQRLFINREEAR